MRISERHSCSAYVERDLMLTDKQVYERRTEELFEDLGLGGVHLFANQVAKLVGCQQLQHRLQAISAWPKIHRIHLISIGRGGAI